jgi:uncharacterized protein YceH (UPF0502 family)
MEPILDELEVRVLGCLIEKELATPEYYPLTVNALTNACNQKSNRDPFMSLEDTEVVRTLDALRMKHLAIQAAEGGRAPKYRHILAERLRLDPSELALLAELLLRGPQTMGELRNRTDRMHQFADLAAVEAVLEELLARTPPLVTRLPRQPGRKESRFAHLFAGEPALIAADIAPPAEATLHKATADKERIARLEEEVAALRAEVAELRQAVGGFKAQFE